MICIVKKRCWAGAIAQWQNTCLARVKLQVQSPTLSKAVVEVERREEEDRSDAGVYIKAVSEGITEEDGQRNGK